jgi:hypothetical protein
MRSWAFRIDLFLVLFVAPLLAADPQLARAHYNFSQPATNGYRVTIDIPSQANPMRYEGVILVSTRPGENNSGLAGFRGFVRRQPQPNAGAARGFFPGARPGNFGPFGPRTFIHLQPLPPGTEAEFQTDGQVLRLPINLDLPRPVDSYASLLFPVLPDLDGKSAETEQVCLVDEEQSDGRMSGYGRGFGPPGMNGPKRLAGARKESIRMLESTSGLLRFERTVEFQTLLKTGKDPYLSWSAKGEISFDRQTGFLTSAKIDGTVLNSTPDYIQKSPIVVTAQRLGPDELSKALAENNLTDPAGITASDVEKLVATVKGDDPAKKSEAAAQLMGVDLEKYHEQLAPLGVAFASDANSNLRSLAARILTKTATAEQVPLLLKMLRSDESSDISSVAETLGRLRDPRAIEPLADLIVHGSDASQSAAEALSQYGSSVEETALAMLKEKHRQTRGQACRILRDCGTSKSIEPLRDAITKADGGFINELAETLRAIRQRGEEAEKLVF